LFIADISLKQGLNNIIITATDKQGNSATSTFAITAELTTKNNIDDADIPIINPGDAVPRFYALLIGENDYSDASLNQLQNPVNDALELKKILLNNYTFDPENIETLINRSREDIMQAMVEMCNKLTDNDNLVIFYAGHGTAEKDRYGDIDGYWVPSSAKKGLDATYISSDDIIKALRRSNSKHILVIADACYSGALARDIGSDATIGIEKQFKLASRKVMTSGNMEPVPDNSKFIYYLKKNLEENQEKYLTAKKLFDSFFEAILNNSDTTPQYAPIKNVGDEGGEFVFIRK